METTLQNTDKTTRADKQLILLMISSVATILFVGFEALAVTTVIPEIVKSLNAVKLFPLAAGISIAIQIFSTALSGIWCDAKGPRQVLIFGIAVFTLGMLICGIAGNIAIFILGRAIQGLGAGMLIVPFYVIVGAIVPAVKQPMFFVAFSAAWVIPGLLGPIGAAQLTQHFGWRSVFFAIIPLVFLSFLILIPLLATIEKKDEKPSASSIKTLFGALGGGIFISLSQISSNLPVGYMLVISTACIVLASLSIATTLPAGTFKLSQGAPSLIVTRGLASAVVICVESLIPVFLVIDKHWQINNVSYLLSIGAVSWFVGSFIQGKVTDEHHRRLIIPLGALAGLIGTVIATVATVDLLPVACLFIGWSLSAIGTGASLSACAVLALQITPKSQHGSISASMQVGDSYSNAMLMAIIGMIYTPLAKMPSPIPYFFPMLLMVVASVVALLAAYRCIKNVTLVENS